MTVMLGLFPGDENSTHQTGQVNSDFHWPVSFAKGEPCNYVKQKNRVSMTGDTIATDTCYIKIIILNCLLIMFTSKDIIW